MFYTNYSMERLYLYKLTFESGATYIGQHIQRKEYDNYISSSSYFKNSGDKLVSREIIIDNVKDRKTLDILETIAIIEDKQISPKNVNGNLGNYCHNLCGGWNKGVPASEEAKEKNRRAHLGKKMSKNSKKLISTYQKALPHKKGYHLTEDHKKKISEGNKGKKLSESHKLKMSLSMKGKTFSEEHKKKLSKSHIGNKSHLGCKATEEQRKRMSDSHIGLHQSEEAKEKIRAYAASHKEEQRQKSKERLEKIKIEYKKAKENGYTGKWNDFQKIYKP